MCTQPSSTVYVTCAIEVFPRANIVRTGESCRLCVYHVAQSRLSSPTFLFFPFSILLSGGWGKGGVHPKVLTSVHIAFYNV